MRSLFFVFLAFSSCASLAQMKTSLDQASHVIEQNTQKMDETGLVIAENTKEIRAYTIGMEYAFPIFCIALFAFNYLFFHRILKQIKKELREIKSIQNLQSGRRK